LKDYSLAAKVPDMQAALYRQQSTVSVAPNRQQHIAENKEQS
jgi:hypothetical protein